LLIDWQGAYSSGRTTEVERSELDSLMLASSQTRELFDKTALSFITGEAKLRRVQAVRMHTGLDLMSNLTV